MAPLLGSFLIVNLTIMGPLKLDGETLGQKHQHYNKLVKEFTSTNTGQEIKKIDYNEPDLDNLFKIDIASKNKDVKYILEVLKCEDMLYISRALKQSLWLITDAKYADIINPDFLHTHLLPQMTRKAGQKLILIIRLNLKDKNRVEQFYKYYEDKKDLNTALKWLPNCSISFIEHAVENHGTDISDDLAKRLCEKSATILEIYARKNQGYNLTKLLSKTTFLLQKDVEKFVNIINSQETYIIPKLNSKSTKLIMKARPDIILDNFEKFATKIYVPSFVKFLKREEIKDFLKKHLENKNLKSWFTFETMKHFIFRMPNEGRFDFIKRICIEKSKDNSDVIPYYDDDVEDDAPMYERIGMCSTARFVPHSSNANLYKWYKFAPFSTAFTDLKKLIRMESNPSERNEIFSVLITCARGNSQNLQTVLQYYRAKHMNEPFKFKIHFVNIVLSQPNSHKFNDETWNILNDIFYSMEVYSENENNVQTCLKYIIVYKVTHDTKVPDIVEKKFNFDTLKSYQNKLNDNEREKVFNYLYRLKITQIQNHTINSESDLKEVMQHIKNVLNLLTDWKKNLINYSIILEKIKEIIKIKNNKSWNEDFSTIYNLNKSWRKHMFEESLSMHPAEETCINALKHDPKILALSKESIFLNDSLILTQLLNKLRVYWPQTMAKTFEDTFRNQLNDKTKHKTSVRGLCVLLPKQQLNDILSKYIPKDSKIIWGEADDSTLSIQKCFAKYMLLARPHPSVDIVLLYAKGDYLQYVLPSVHSILFNISSDQSIKHIPTLLDAPVSLQKHGLKIAFAKLKMDELLPIFLNTWKTTKNSSIRATIFTLIFELMCKEQNENKIMEIWHLLDIFIDNLTLDENRIIYITLSYAKKVPLSIKQAFCIKSYRYLRTLPPKANCDAFIESVIRSTLDIMESLDLDFLVEVIFDSFDKKFTKNYYSFCNVISACLLSSKSEATQTQRYEKVFIPLLEKYLAFIKNTEVNSQSYVKYNFNDILRQLHKEIEHITIKKNMITPIKLFNAIHNDLQKYFSGEDYYVLIMTWNLAAKYMVLIDKYRVNVNNKLDEDEAENESNNSKGNTIYAEAASEFGKVCMELLKEELKQHFSSIFMLFSNALKELFDQFDFNTKTQLATLSAIQQHTSIIEGHLLVLQLLPEYFDDSKEEEEKQKICEVLASHPSAEVRMHYQQMLRTKERYL